MGSVPIMDHQGQIDSVCASFHKVLDQLLNTAHNVSNDPVFKVPDSDEIPSLQEISRIGESTPVEKVIQDAFEVFDYRNRSNHPRCMAFIPSPVSPYAWLGHCISNAFNTFAGSRLQGSGVAIVEQTVIQFLAQQAGLPDTAGGVFVSGGSMANLTALALARDRIIPSGKEQLGVAYLSDQTHYSVAKALKVLGFKKRQIHIVASNDNFEMNPSALGEAIAVDREANLIPFLVVGTSGTTNTGSVDPLAAISPICKREGLWFHIDGAYGASACLSATRSESVQGLGLADSISWDAHKWLFQTYGCSLVLVKEKKHLVQNFANDGDYLRDAVDDEEIPNFWDYGIELTRPARAMRLWFTLKVLGVDKVKEMVDQGFFLAERAEEELRKLDDWKVTSHASLAIVTFRYSPGGKSEEELDELNVAIQKRLLADNVAGILTTMLRGRVVLRMCSISPLLTTEEMAGIVKSIDQIAKELGKDRTIDQ